MRVQDQGRRELFAIRRETLSVRWEFELRCEESKRAAAYEQKLLEFQREEANRRDKADERKALHALQTQAEENKHQQELVRALGSGGELDLHDGTNIKKGTYEPVPSMITFAGSSRPPTIPPLVKGPQS